MELFNKKEGKTPRPKYNMWQCSGFMIGTAWREKEKKVLVLCLLQAFFAVAANIINLYFPPAIISVVERHGSFARLMFMIAIFVGVTMICSGSSTYVGVNTLYGRISVRGAIITAINKKCCMTSYPNTEDETFIKLRSKSGQAVAGNNEATEAVWETLTSLLQNVVGFLIYIILLSTFDFWLVLVILATALTGYFVNKQLNSYGYRHREEEAEITGKLGYNIGLAKNYSAAKDIRIFGMKPWMDEVNRKAMSAYTAFHRRANNKYIWGNILDLVLAFLRNGFAYVYLIHLVITKKLDVAQFLLYFSAVGGFTAWVSGILDSLTTLYRQSLDLSTVREFLDYPEPFLFENGKRLEKKKGEQHELRLEHVSFRYPNADHDTLHEINLTLHSGEKLAVVGLNGAGKTTLIKIICGFFDPTEGRVLLDGEDIRQYNRRDYYALFSAVFQDFSLLAGTVAANVAQTEDHIDRDLVKSCIQKAGLTEKIESLPEQYEALMNRRVYEDAVEFSGGEVQRLMLARALYKEAPFILLDEPTAALDPIAEADIYQKYNEMTKGCSSIYISHRLASTRFCDRILLIDDHGIAEEGTHEDLLKLGGIYAGLFEVQSKYYREGENDGKREETSVMEAGMEAE